MGLSFFVGLLGFITQKKAHEEKHEERVLDK